MKFFNIPKEGVVILIHGIIGFIILISLFGCSPLTTFTSLDTCEVKVGDQKTKCIKDVKAKQRQYSGRRNMFIGIGGR